MRLVLASASPRRAELLLAAGFAIDLLPVHIDETPQPGEEAGDYVRRLAAEKSARAQDLLAGSGRADVGLAGSDGLVVLGADTAVVVDGQILGKPRDERDAASMLARLAGRAHEVVTGVCVRQGPAEAAAVEWTRVFVTSLDAEDIRWYVDSGEGADKAGAYAIQGLASRFVTRVEGSYSNVVGLPVATVCRLLHHLGAPRGQTDVGHPSDR